MLVKMLHGDLGSIFFGVVKMLSVVPKAGIACSTAELDPARPCCAST